MYFECGWVISREKLKFWLIMLCIILMDGELKVMFGVRLSFLNRLMK